MDDKTKNKLKSILSKLNDDLPPTQPDPVVALAFVSMQHLPLVERASGVCGFNYDIYRHLYHRQHTLDHLRVHEDSTICCWFTDAERAMFQLHMPNDVRPFYLSFPAEQYQLARVLAPSLSGTAVEFHTRDWCTLEEAAMTLNNCLCSWHAHLGVGDLFEPIPEWLAAEHQRQGLTEQWKNFTDTDAD